MQSIVSHDCRIGHESAAIEEDEKILNINLSVNKFVSLELWPSLIHH